jgi:exonuclease SbcD
MRVGFQAYGQKPLVKVWISMHNTHPSLTLLHSSDWHLGRALYGRKRYEEFERFLDWLSTLMEREAVDVLLVAGDVFDSGTPSSRAQELYYRFLCRAAASRCSHVVIIAGNHDSASFLNAPRDVLRALNVHVLGAAAENPVDEALALRDADGNPLLIVCAVPYLRERDIRLAEAGESVADKDRKSVEGIRRHYERVFAAGFARQRELGGDIPVVGMGHLFAAGGKTMEGDGVRDLYVGALAQAPADIFPEALSYAALGHLHVPQKVGGRERVRYSGSPLPMGFGEAGQEKSVCLLRFGGGEPELRLVPVPRFQALERVSGDRETIAARLEALKESGSNAWLEIQYTGDQLIGDLRERVEEQLAGSALEALRIGVSRPADRLLTEERLGESLEDLSLTEVFTRCLAAHEVPEDQRPELLRAYTEIVKAVQEEE